LSDSGEYSLEFATSNGKQSQDMEVRHVKVKHSLDVLAELEKIKKTSTKTKKRSTADRSSLEDLLLSSSNHKKEIQKSFDIEVNKAALKQMRKVNIVLKLEDEKEKPLMEISDLSISIRGAEDVSQVFLDLKLKLEGK